MRPLIERFTEKYEPVTETGCWIWTAALSDGYGQIEEKGKFKWAHRISYEIHKGNIPAGLQIDHLCRIRCCVNPEHLEAVSPKENVRRGLKGVLKTHCPKGHPYSGSNLYLIPKGGRDCRTCRSAADAKFKFNKLMGKHI